MKTIAVLGSGSWGTALAVHLGSAGHDVRLWGRNAELIDEMNARRANAVYLPDIVLPSGVMPTASLEGALHRAEIVVAALPSHGTRAVIRSAAPFISRQALIVSATKGIEQDTLLRVSEIIAQEVRGARPVAVLSGPSFAIEVARRLPTAVSVACADPVLAEDVQREFRAAYFRLYGSTDVVGVEIGGALKNIIAIAAGVVEGLGLGQNALALVLIAYIALKMRLRIRAFPAIHQASVVFGLLLLNEFVLFWIDGLAGHPVTDWTRWIPVLTGAAAWPFLSAFFTRAAARA